MVRHRNDQTQQRRQIFTVLDTTIQEPEPTAVIIIVISNRFTEWENINNWPDLIESSYCQNPTRHINVICFMQIVLFLFFYIYTWTAVVNKKNVYLETMRGKASRTDASTATCTSVNIHETSRKEKMKKYHRFNQRDKNYKWNKL